MAVAVQIEIDVAAVAERAGHPIAGRGRVAGARGVHGVIVPVVHDHREHQVVARVGQDPVFAGLGPVLDVANAGENGDGVGDDRAAGLHDDFEIVEQMFGAGLPGRGANGVDGGPHHLGARQARAEHGAFAGADLVGVGLVAQIVDRDAAADVDMLQPVARLAMQPEQVLPHRGKGLDIRLGIRRLRADVNMDARQMDPLRLPDRTKHHLARLRGRDAELRRVERRLQRRVRTRPDAGHQPDRHVGPLAEPPAGLSPPGARAGRDGAEHLCYGWLRAPMRPERASSCSATTSPASPGPSPSRAEREPSSASTSPSPTNSPSASRERGFRSPP